MASPCFAGRALGPLFNGAASCPVAAVVVDAWPVPCGLVVKSGGEWFGNCTVGVVRWTPGVATYACLPRRPGGNIGGDVGSVDEPRRPILPVPAEHAPRDKPGPGRDQGEAGATDIGLGGRDAIDDGCETAAGQWDRDLPYAAAMGPGAQHACSPVQLQGMHDNIGQAVPKRGPTGSAVGT